MFPSEKSLFIVEMNFVRHAYEVVDTPIVDARWTLADWVGVCFICVVHSALPTVFLQCVVYHIYAWIRVGVRFYSYRIQACLVNHFLGYVVVRTSFPPCLWPPPFRFLVAVLRFTHRPLSG